MRLAHPPSKLVPAFHSHLLLFHVLLKVFGADPTRVELCEEGEEGGHILLVDGGRMGWVGGAEGVQKGPG